MLVLSRKKEEAILIGDNISVTILGIEGNHVKLGITAPKEIPVHRQEVHERLEAERNKQA